MSRPDQTLAAFLDTQIPILVLGTNLFNGPVRAKSEDTPSKSVFLILDGGLSPRAYNGELNTLQFPTVQIRIRGDKKCYDDGLDLARQVRDEAHYAPLDGFMDVRVAETEPSFLGEDEGGHPEWSLNVNMAFEGAL